VVVKSLAISPVVMATPMPCHLQPVSQTNDFIIRHASPPPLSRRACWWDPFSPTSKTKPPEIILKRDPYWK